MFVIDQYNLSRMSIVAVLHFSHQSRENFVELSKPLLEYLQHVNQGGRFSSLQPLLVQGGKFSLVSSWSGNVFNNETGLVISINQIFATSNGLKENSQVTISILSDQALPASSISICPLEPSDWDIMNLNSESIEYTLRDQIMFIRNELVFTYFVSPSLPVQLQVLSTTPSNNIVYLQEHTEVHILPTSNLSSHRYKVPVTKIVQSSISTCLLDEDSYSPTPEHFTKNLCIKRIASIESVIREGNEEDNYLPPYKCFASKEIFKDRKNNCCLETSRCYAEISCANKNNKMQHGDEEVVEEEIKIVVSINFLPSKTFHSVFPHSSFDELYANPIILEQLGVKNGKNITVNCYHNDLVTCQGILVHCSSEVMPVIEGNLRILIMKYLEKCILNSESEILLNQGTLFKLEINGKVIHAVTELMGVVNSVCGKIGVDTLQFVTVEKDEDLIAEPNQIARQQRSLSCDEIVDEGLFKVFLNLKALLSQPKIVRKKYCLPFDFHQKIILLHGASSAVSSGCGKSFLTHLLKQCFTSRPFCNYVNIIDCVSLRGKKVETIAELWNKVLDEAIVKGDAIIIFDDLDELLPNMENQQDGHLTNIYGEKLSEAFQNLIEYIFSLSTLNIHVVATSSCLQSLQKSLLPNSNMNLFNHFVKVPAAIDPINALMWTLRNISQDDLQQKWNLDMSAEETFNLRREMEGFNFKEIQSLVTEVKNLHLKDLVSDFSEQNNKNTQELSYEQFLLALKTFKDSVKHNINLYNANPISFDDVGGLEEVKSSLMENLIWPELYRELFSATQINLRSGILLYGVPGTAKTMLASAVAYQSKLNFISIKGPELLSKYVGSSEGNVRDLFARAQAAKPCILFFDEFDSLAPRRGHDNTGVTDRVVNQLLTQLDGVEDLDRVYILAATSRPDLIDPALLRPGRLDKSILCPLPDDGERKQILEILLKKFSVSDDVDLERIASATKHYSGADLKALVYNAQLERVHQCLELKQLEDNESNAVVIEMEDFLTALSSTQPSLTLDEQKRFENIFYKFRDGRFDGANQQQLKGGKVTLA